MSGRSKLQQRSVQITMVMPQSKTGEVPPIVLVGAAVVAIALIIIGLLMILPEKTETPTVNDTTLLNQTKNITNGTVEGAFCLDTDNGKNLFESGVISTQLLNSSDSCLNQTHVREFYCADKTVMNESLACPSGYVCSSGACIVKPVETLKCIDSDNGTDYKTTGVVQYGGKNYTDTCVLISQVKEYYCLNDSLKSTNFVCDPWAQCVSGSCVDQPANCTETDSGKNETKKGTVSIYRGLNLVSMETDECVDNSSLREYFCSNNFMGSEIMNCGGDYECSKGACIYSSCEDSDGGQNLLKKGTTSKGTVSEDDECSDTYNVEEYYCSDNKIQSTTNTCPSGYWCSAGECVVEPDCSDTDSGNDIYNSGTVTKGTESKADSCNGIILTEYYCDGKAIKSQNVDCSGTGACTSGACVVT